MRITTQAWETYIRRLAQLNEKAAQLMAEYLAAHGTADTEALTDYAAALVQKYGEGSAELACQMYDAMAALQNARVSPAEPAAPASRREVARMVLATRESPPQMQRGVSRLVKRAGADTTLKNAQRDGAEFAWVPHGDSCAFCLTLASRGWQRASQAAIKGGHAEHIHANCDCEYAVRFDGRTSVAGYDPEAYLAQYNAAGGDINRMRRVNYAKNKERINAQKRAAYALRQKNRGKKVAITDIAIQKVPLVAPNGANDQTAFFIQETHKEPHWGAQPAGGYNMIKGIDVTLYERTQTGEDDFGAAVYSETPVTVHNVLVGEPETADLVNELQLYGKRLAYVLAIPKGDTHDWEGAAVAFFGQKFRAYGSVTQGMEAMIPLRWNKKVKVERYE